MRGPFIYQQCVRDGTEPAYRIADGANENVAICHEERTAILLRDALNRDWVSTMSVRVGKDIILAYARFVDVVDQNIGRKVMRGKNPTPQTRKMDAIRDALVALEQELKK